MLGSLPYTNTSMSVMTLQQTQAPPGQVTDTDKEGREQTVQQAKYAFHLITFLLLGCSALLLLSLLQLSDIHTHAYKASILQQAKFKFSIPNNENG